MLTKRQAIAIQAAFEGQSPFMQGEDRFGTGKVHWYHTTNMGGAVRRMVSDLIDRDLLTKRYKPTAYGLNELANYLLHRRDVDDDLVSCIDAFEAVLREIEAEEGRTEESKAKEIHAQLQVRAAERQARKAAAFRDFLTSNDTFYIKVENVNDVEILAFVEALVELDMSI